ncbi:MAG: helix-turn-helix domain-containing protein, partial [Bacteroidia bacterium]|nr:helix-turn-helix domain-containing protein [Bacteroidia bacterium]
AYLLIFVSSIIVYIRFRIYRLTRDKVRLEKEVRSRTEELEIKNKQLAEIDRIKTQFFTDISHEIRTPLTLITGPIDILTKTYEGNDKVSGMLAAMKRNSDRLMQLVNELLDIVRLDAGKMKITLIEDDIISNLRMLVYEFLSLAESKKIRYIVEIPDSPLITWFDSYKLNIIITNLLSNAFRYTPSEGTVRCMIKIESNDRELNTKYITITVSDTGRGISKEHIERIFERFYRVEGHHESDGHGTGIGLSMVKEFINLLHGEIKVNSTPGKGSSFTVKIPLGKDHLPQSEFVITETRSEPSRPPAITRAELQLENLTGPRHGNLAKILLIEDNSDLRNFIIENLSDSYHLLEADNGKTGLGLAYSMIPDLIISDIMMPDFDGIQLCSKLKNDVRTSHIPIILLTAKATTDDKLTGLKSGADDYIFNMDELKTRLANLLTTRERLKQKYLDPKSLEKIEENNKSVDDLFMEKVIRLIKGNISNFDFDVASLHYSLGMSRMHLSRKLKALTGISPHLLINRIRMEKAAELLRLNRGNITEIANSVGISNPANFSRSFREHFGTSPKSYMKQFRSADKSLL